MRDGVILRVNLYRPAGRGPFPVILCAHPYGKDALPKRRGRRWAFSAQYRIMRQPSEVAFSDQTGWEAPDPAWWTARGYAVVNADLRGAGVSDGVGSTMSDDEGEDVYSLIEWAGTQSWSTGSVGMLGVSYLAISQYKAAALRPPHLRAICPWEGLTDAYRDLFSPGGISERGFSSIWLAGLKRKTRNAVDLRAERNARPLRDEWWRSLAPRLSEIQVPMLVCTSFSDGNLHTVGSFRAFEQAGSSDRFAYTHRAGKWQTFYSNDAKAVQLAFFDRYLRDLDVPPPPRVRLEVRASRDEIVEVRSEHEWPLARTHWRSLYLGDGGTLSDTPSDRAGEISFATRKDAAAFTFIVPRDIELTGPMNLLLWVSVVGADDASLFVGAEKWDHNTWVPFEGSYGYGRDRIALGWQKLSLRELDPASSKPHRPEHLFTTPQLLRPGEIVPCQIPLGPSSTLLRTGESLRLLVAGRTIAPRNPLTGHFPAHYAPSARCRVTLHWSPAMPAALEVPEIPPG
nr:CocE/NonD family hydrolase [Antricoccus suffuscus]